MTGTSRTSATAARSTTGRRPSCRYAGPPTWTHPWATAGTRAPRSTPTSRSPCAGRVSGTSRRRADGLGALGRPGADHLVVGVVARAALHTWQRWLPPHLPAAGPVDP